MNISDMTDQQIIQLIDKQDRSFVSIYSPDWKLSLSFITIAIFVERPSTNLEVIKKMSIDQFSDIDIQIYGADESILSLNLKLHELNCSELCQNIRQLDRFVRLQPFH